MTKSDQNVNRSSICKLFIFTIAFASAFCLPLSAQTFYGSITGTVTDSSGGIIPGASVTLISLGTAEQRSAVTDSTGSYRFVNLVPGQYRLQVEMSGFKRLAREPIAIEVQSTVRIDAALQIGQLSETVEVTSATPLLQTENTALSQVVEGRQLQEMPLNGRNVLNLVALVPGVIPQGNTSGVPATQNVNGWGNYQIGGGMANQSSSFFDGAPLNVSYVNSVVLVPTQDAVQEFRVSTNSSSPEFGRSAGGAINITSKSGTNQFHGSAYEYFRNNVLNANDFFNNRSGLKRPQWNQNQFGGTISGPAIKDKTFFLFTWEDLKLRTGSPSVNTIPTAAMKEGDFSAAGIPKIYDALTVCGKYGNPACANDSKGSPIYLRQAFAGNKIPANRIDPTAKAMLFYWGQPNQPGVVNNYVANGTGGADSYQINTRGDHVLSDKQRLFARYTRWVGQTIADDMFKNKANGNPRAYVTNSAVIGDTYTFTPKTLGDFRISYIRFEFGFYPLCTGADLSQFGPSFAALQNQVTWAQFPSPSITSMQSSSYTTVRNANNNFALSANITKMAGRHSLKFGGESRWIEWNYAQTNYSSGRFTFTNAFTAANPFSSAGSGYAFASFLLGYMSSGLAQQVNIASQQQYYHGLFLADTFQLNRKLTLNLGVRWEYPGSFRERHDSATVLLPDVADPLGTKVGLPLKGLVALVNSPDYPSRTIHPANWKLLAPRIGVAYQMTRKIVVRAAYSLMYPPNDVVFGNAPWTSPTNQASTVIAATLDGGITPFNVLSNPFPNGLIQPVGHSPAYAANLIGSDVQAPVPDQPYSSANQWNLSIQAELFSGAALEVGYAGAKGTHLPLNNGGVGFPLFQMNQIPDQYLSMGTALTTQVANPFYGKVPSTAGILAQPTVTQGQLLRPFPQYLSLNNESNMWGNSTYHSLQTKFEKRFGSAGGTFLAAYTFAKLISNTDTMTAWLERSSALLQNYHDMAAEKSLASFNVPHRAVFSYVLDLPFGRGKKFMQGVSGIADKVISGWGLTGATAFQTGYPALLTAQPTTLSTSFGGGTPRPNYTAGCEKNMPGRAQDRVNKWFNTACFSQPGPFAFGNEGRTDPNLRYHGINNWDLAIYKNTAVTETVRLRFEGQVFNLANRTQFNAPNTQLGNSSFGIVTASRNDPRLIQFSLRLTF